MRVEQLLHVVHDEREHTKHILALALAHLRCSNLSCADSNTVPHGRQVRALNAVWCACAWWVNARVREVKEPPRLGHVASALRNTHTNHNLPRAALSRRCCARAHKACFRDFQVTE
jgi:hypothetical protein